MNSLSPSVILMVVVGVADLILGMVAAKRGRPVGRAVAMLGAAVAVCGAGQIIEKVSVPWIGSTIAIVGDLSVIAVAVAVVAAAIKHRSPASSEPQ